MFAALGIKVDLIEGRDNLLGFLDAQVGDSLANCIRSMGINLHLSSEIKDVSAADKIVIKLSTGTSIKADTLLAASVEMETPMDWGLKASVLHQINRVT